MKKSFPATQVDAAAGRGEDAAMACGPQQANHTEADTVSSRQATRDAIVRNPPQVRYPLTDAERAMAVAQRMDPASVQYNVRLAQRITGPLDAMKLRAALAGLLARHAVLRSHYVDEGGELWHKIAGDMPMDLPVLDCAAEGIATKIDAANVPYDLAKDPLFRFALYRLDAQEHVLSLGFHHIVMDGVSVPVLLGELGALYEGRALPPLDLDYFDFALYRAGAGEDEAGRAFFLDQFQDGVPETEMPTHAIRPAELPVADRDCRARMDFAPIQAASKALGATPYQLMMAAAGLTLMKYTGSDDVVLGTAMSGRTLPETARMVGMFVNTVPVRMKLDGAQDGAAFVSAVVRLIRDAKSHQSYPFDRLVPVLAPDRNPSRGPVFDLMVNYLGKLPPFDVGELSVRDDPVRTQALAHDLVLELRAGDGALDLSLAYSAALYDEAVVRNMLDQLCAIVERLCKCASLPIGELCELPDAQREQILVEFKGEVVDWRRDETVVDLFREQAKKTPDAPAVVFKDTRLSYRELDHLSDNLAAELARRGCDRGKIVGILIQRSAWMPVCALGALKAGACYMPLDPSYPTDRLAYMLQDAGAEQLIYDEDLRELVQGYQGGGLSTASIPALPAPDTPPMPPAPDDALVLLYTSGTTGMPKGCILTHANLVSYIGWHLRLHGITEKDRVLCYASFGFDAHMLDLYPILMVGGVEHIIPEEMRLDLPGIDRYCAQNGITFLFMTTQLGRQFAESHKSRTVRRIVVGGEALVPLTPPEDLEVFNAYGPTECTIICTQQPVDRLYDRVPIGRAGENTAVYVVDKQNRLAPVGVAGELLIAGRQVGRGYLNRPDLTAEKFTPNPFSGEADYDRVYRTGDVVRFLPDGSIDFVGRRDFQVKIRGFRVELTEIESRIRQHPAVRDAAVVALDAPGGGKCAVAYIVGDEPIDVNALNDFIEEALPPYMVPAATMQLAAIPINPNGKVDRRKLPAPVYGGSEESASARPLNSLETKLAAIAAEVLGHDQFGLTDNLMRQGLTSLSCIKLIGRIDDALGAAPSVRDFMKDPTLLALENAVLDKLLSRTDQPAFEGGHQALSEYPLSASQQGIYFECMLNPGSTFYNVPLAFELSGAVDAARLQRAVEAAIDAYPVLSMRTALSGGVPVQMMTGLKANVPVENLSEAQLQEVLGAWKQPFDLEQGPLCRAKIVVTERRTLWLFDAHHIAFDGTSVGVLTDAVDRAYRGDAPSMEKLSQMDFALEDAGRAGGDAWREDEAFFAALLSDYVDPSDLPGDLPASGKVGTARQQAVSVPREQVEAFAKRTGITASATMLAATGYALGRWLGSRDAYMAGISSGRSDPRLSGSMGMFVRTLPLRVRRGMGQSRLDFARAVGDMFAGAIDHEGYPYTKVAERFGFSAPISYSSELGLLQAPRIGVCEAKIIGLGEGDAPKFPLSITATESERAFTLNVEYDDARYSEALGRALAETLQCALLGIISAPDAPIATLSLLSGAEAEAIARFNDTGTAEEAVFVDVFERAADAYADRIALTGIDGAYTFAQMDARANRIANALMARGVGLEDRVALLLPRTTRMPVAMLGVMKAGGAFIPIDPDYPEDRVRHVLEDSRAKLMITAPEWAESYPDAVDFDALMAEGCDQRPRVAIAPTNACYLIYTSGSTGVPKGVVMEHRGLANYVRPSKENLHALRMRERGHALMTISTVAFDAFEEEVWVPLCNGLTLVLADEHACRDAAALAALFQRTGADILCGTPSRIAELMMFPALGEAIANCKLVIVGGEKLPDALLKKIEALPDSNIWMNSYGPTETTIACNCVEVNGRTRVTVGPPMLGVHEQIVDSDLNPLPRLMTGELTIAGIGVARGYHNLPEQTEARFVTVAGERAYRSGDLACWTEDGEVVILGRNDSQIKLRGLRIELGEIESRLMEYPGVDACAVVIRKIGDVEHICAYYVAQSPLDPEDIRREMGKKLTPYMVPTAMTQLAAMPKTPNGKTDLRALPSPVPLKAGVREKPANALEQRLCEVFEQVLSLENVGATDSFFDLGGSSLQVTRLVFEAQSIDIKDARPFGYADVFQNPSPRQLARLMRSGSAQVQNLLEGEGFDYAAIDALLAHNTTEALRERPGRALGTVLLTGATGFLGIHVLRELVERSGADVIHCLVRKGRLPAQKRLQNLLFYYFENDYQPLFQDGRIRVIEGDLLEPGTMDALLGLDIDTVFNCAATVAHFASEEGKFDVNVRGVRRLIELCGRRRARLVHVSTVSVCGLSVDGCPGPDAVFDERALFVGQTVNNQYIHSKFMAEREILSACAADGLDAKIMRAGNLMARELDSEFQINAQSNSFIGVLRAFYAVGCFPYSSYEQTTDLTPIDSTAEAIVMLSQTAEACRVFHPYNNHPILMGDLIRNMNEAGLTIDMVEDGEFDAAFAQAAKQSGLAEQLLSLVAYRTEGAAQVRDVLAENHLTTQALVRLGFHWPETSSAYQASFLKALDGLGVFKAGDVE